ncbi:MAG: hypothetical protein Q9182_000670 [Xanthomendoza sp. 2 TL-2023]
MARIQIPIDALTSRLNLGSRLEGVGSQSLGTRFANLRPVSEFLNFSRLSKPANFAEVQSRVNYNLGYFSSNYVAVAIMLSIYSLLTNLTLLFDIIFVGLGLFAIKKLDGRDLELGFGRATTSQLYTGLFVIAIPLFIWANPISSALWLVGATGVSILGHASFMDKPIDTAFSEEAAGKRRQPQERLFEEINSDDDDGQGVTLDRSYFSDELHFTGHDSATHTRNRRKLVQEPDSQSSEEGQALESRSSGTMQLALRNKEDRLVEQALERIQRAQMLGKPNVELSQPEIEALERKRRQDEARGTRAASDSRHADRQRSGGQLTAKELRPGKRRSVGKGSTYEGIHPSDRTAGTPPGILVPGPDGRLSHTPLGYYPSTANQVPASRGSRSGSRSGSSANLQQSTSPISPSQYWSPQPRYPSDFEHAPPSPASRNSPSLRRLPDDPRWNPRPRSASSNQPYPPPDQYYYQQYSSPPLPTSGQGRRIVSGPAEIQYPNLRRPLPTPSAHPALSEPSLQRRAHSREQYEHSGDAEDSDDDDDNNYGVQVDVLPHPYGYEVSRGPEPWPGVRSRPPR